MIYSGKYGTLKILIKPFEMSGVKYFGFLILAGMILALLIILMTIRNGEFKELQKKVYEAMKVQD